MTNLTCNGITVVLEELPHWQEYNDLVEELNDADTPERREMLSVLYNELYYAIYGENADGQD